MKRAFTLIELLVVIAIIAILAAILFPVFAQAKMAAKKTAHISNYKQQGTSIQIYLADYDDTFPQGFVRRPTVNTWAYGVVHPVPANAILTAPWDQPARVAMAQCYWANAVQPYMKNIQLFEMSAARAEYRVGGEIYNPGVTSGRMGENYNGYLHTYNATAIENVGVVPVLWNVQSVNGIARSFSTPTLPCLALTGDCRFNPTGRPDGDPNSSNAGYYVYDFVNTTWQYDKKGVYSRADTSTKVQPIGTTVDPNYVGWTGKLIDPWAGVSATGIPLSLWPCNSTFNGQSGAAGGDAWCYFRPDRTQ